MLKTASISRAAATPSGVTGRPNKGAAQLSDDLFTKYGRPGGDIFDENDNVFATARKMADENAKLQSGDEARPDADRTVVSWIHQQGYAGAAAHMANPDGVAWQNVRKFYKSDATAKSAIWGNLDKADKQAFGTDGQRHQPRLHLGVVEAGER